MNRSIMQRLVGIALASVLASATLVRSAELKFNTQDLPPFNYAVDGVVAGPGVDVIKAVCKDAGLECSFQLYPWLRAYKEIEDGLAHGLFLIGHSEEREKLLYFSPPVVATSYGFFVHADDALSYQKPADMTGYTVGVFGPSNTSKSLERVRDQMIKEGVKPLMVEMRPDDESGFRKLGAKRVQAVYSNAEVGHAMLSKLGIKNIRFAGATERLKYYIGLSRKQVDQATYDKFAKSFRKLHSQGVIGNILAGYQMKDVPQKSWNEK